MVTMQTRVAWIIAHNYYVKMAEECVGSAMAHLVTSQEVLVEITCLFYMTPLHLATSTCDVFSFLDCNYSKVPRKCLFDTSDNITVCKA